MPRKAQQPSATEMSAKDELELRLKIVQAEVQAHDARFKMFDVEQRITRDDVRAISESYRKLMQGPLIINAAGLLIFLNQWKGLVEALGKGVFGVVATLFALGVVAGMIAIYDAMLQTMIPSKTAEAIKNSGRWWAFYISAGCFLVAVFACLFRLWQT